MGGKSKGGQCLFNDRNFTPEPQDRSMLPVGSQNQIFRPWSGLTFTSAAVSPRLRMGAQCSPLRPKEPHFDSSRRHNLDWPGVQEVVRFYIKANGSLGRLRHYATRWFRDSPRDEPEGRALRLLFGRELMRCPSPVPTIADWRNLPDILTTSIATPPHPTVEDLAKILNQSRSPGLKLFRKIV